MNITFKRNRNSRMTPAHPCHKKVVFVVQSVRNLEQELSAQCRKGYYEINERDNNTFPQV